jgi:hypothetical protein
MSVAGRDLRSLHGKAWERTGPIVKLDVEQAEFMENNEHGELFMMSAGGPWAVSDNPNAKPGEPSEYHDILLLKCVDPKAGIFHRFGLATLNVVENKEIFDWVKEYDDNEAEMPCVAYDPERHLHTIIVK